MPIEVTASSVTYDTTSYSDLAAAGTVVVQQCISNSTGGGGWELAGRLLPIVSHFLSESTVLISYNMQVITKNSSSISMLLGLRSTRQSKKRLRQTLQPRPRTRSMTRKSMTRISTTFQQTAISGIVRLSVVACLSPVARPSAVAKRLVRKP